MLLRELCWKKNGDVYEVKWKNGDVITIVDGEGKAVEYVTTSETTEGVFTPKNANVTVGPPPYKAYYGINIEYKQVAPYQNYLENTTDRLPMVAESNTTNLNFKNIGGILRVNISTDSHGVQLSKIELKSNQNLAGTINNLATLPTDLAINFDYEYKTIAYYCQSLKLTSEQKSCYIVVPANTYTDLEFEMTASTLYSFSKKLKTGKSVVVERSKITDVNFNLNWAPHEGAVETADNNIQHWVQLWRNGPKWATNNIGSDGVLYKRRTAYQVFVIGGLYSWRGRYDAIPDAGYGDTAAYTWGSNWRMPTRAEMNELITRCNWEYCDGVTKQAYEHCTIAGWKVTGKNAYANNFIFLPLAGIKDQNVHSVSGVGTRGCYWIDESGGYGAYFLELTSNSKGIKSHNRPHGCSVRPVYIGQ